MHLLFYVVIEEYLTIKEAAILLKVHPATIKRWIKAGTLPALKIGRTVRILKTDLPTCLRRSRARRNGGLVNSIRMTGLHT